MKKVISILMILVLVNTVSAISKSFHEKYDLNSKVGKELLIKSLQENHGNMFLKTAMWYEAQRDVVSCGIASVSMALNTLNIGGECCLLPPLKLNKPKYKMFTQENIFSQPCEKQCGITRDLVLKQPGVTMTQVTNILNSFKDLNAELFFANKEDYKASAQNMKKALNNGNFIIAGVDNKALEQTGGGHISPVVAYTNLNGKDYFFFYNTSNFKCPPRWISAEELHFAMNTKDSTDGKCRGYIIINKK